ncbi:MAG: DNA polymerase IV [Patescibacteria group bacterium]
MILHIDLNSFFARVEQQAQPALRNRPIGILGKGHKGARTCICAASPEAKIYGIKSGFSVWEAKQLCPELILVPPDYPKYLDISRRFMAILGEFSPWVEIFSIDEAFVALQRNEKSEIPNSKFETNHKFQNSRHRAISNFSHWEIGHSFEIRNLKLGITEAELQEAIIVAQSIKTRLKQEFGNWITASVGIAWGKIFAKLAGELQKPDGLVVLEQKTWLDRVGNLSVGELCGVGYRLQEHLKNIGITTIRHLSQADAGQFVARFGPAAGMRLWQIGQGIDRSPVEPSHNLAPAKSIGHQITLDHDQTWRVVYPFVTKLLQKVGRRLRRAGLAAGRLSLHVSLAGGDWGDSLRHQPALTSDAALLRSIHFLWQRARIHPSRPVIRLGVVASNLKPAGQPILPLFPALEREDALTKAIDKVRNHYGEGSIEWGSSFNTEIGNLRDWRGPRAVLDQ